MATKLSRNDVPTAWSTYLAAGATTARSSRLGRRDSVERQRRTAQLRELVASGTYKVNLEQVAAALIQRGGLVHGAESTAIN
jgi:hypothetical protein